MQSSLTVTTHGEKFIKWVKSKMDGPSKVKYYDQKELEDFEKLKT